MKKIIGPMLIALTMATGMASPSFANVPSSHDNNHCGLIDDIFHLNGC